VPNEVMTAKQLAEYLQQNEMTIYRLAREGKIPAMRIGRSWRFKKELIDQWLVENSGYEGLNCNPQLKPSE